MPLDLGTLLQSLAGLGQGFAQGQQQAFANRLQQGQSDRAQANLESLLALNELARQRRELELQPGDPGQVATLAASRGVDPSQLEDLRRLEVLPTIQALPVPHPPEPGMHPLEEELLRARIEATRALGKQRKRPPRARAGTDPETLLRLTADKLSLARQRKAAAQKELQRLKQQLASKAFVRDRDRLVIEQADLEDQLNAADREITVFEEQLDRLRGRALGVAPEDFVKRMSEQLPGQQGTLQEAERRLQR